MRTDPSLRERYPSEQIHGGYTIPTLPGPPPREVSSSSGALTRIMAGLFGSGSPVEATVTPGGDTDPKGLGEQVAIYHYHEGDLFTPGAMNYVFEPAFELPLVTIWGNAFMRTPNTFSVRQPPPPVAYPNVVTNGLGGVVAGQMILQGLEQVDE